MARLTPRLIIDARPRGPRGPLAGEVVLGRPVLAHLLELAASLGAGQVVVHARADEHGRIRSLLKEDALGSCRFVTGPPPENTAILRTDRLYDPSRLGRALRRGRDPETAVVWRLDTPAALAGADDELLRRQSFQPLGRYWALQPARLLAGRLLATRVRPNHLTLLSATLVLSAGGMTALATPSLGMQLGTAFALAAALILDTADGHLARIQGTASAFGRWLDANLDELGDMALHAAIAWSAFLRERHAYWLLAGILYAAGKYLFVVGNQTWAEREPNTKQVDLAASLSHRSWMRRVAHLAGHADVRWHAWILLAALGWLRVELVVFAVYYPVRALAAAYRKAASDG